VQIQGRVRGTINDLSGRNLEIELGRGAFLRGRLDLKDITIPGQGYFGVSLQEARTSMRVLEQIIPKFNLPDNFDRLGNVQFRGDINGFFATGFTIFGLLRSDLGIADLDMTLNPNGGKEKATYSGSLSLQDFDLGEWTQNPDFGKVSPFCIGTKRPQSGSSDRRRRADGQTAQFHVQRLRIQKCQPGRLPQPKAVSGRF
jgi:hypothetical protein